MNNQQKSSNKRGGARPNTGGRRTGAGRKSKVEELGLPTLLSAVAGADGDRLVWKKLLAKARKGELKAMELWLAYRWGRPRQAVELTGRAGGPVEISSATDELKRRLSRLASARDQGGVPPKSD